MNQRTEDIVFRHEDGSTTIINPNRGVQYPACPPNSNLCTCSVTNQDPEVRQSLECKHTGTADTQNPIFGSNFFIQQFRLESKTGETSFLTTVLMKCPDSAGENENKRGYYKPDPNTQHFLIFSKKACFSEFSSSKISKTDFISYDDLDFGLGDFSLVMNTSAINGTMNMPFWFYAERSEFDLTFDGSVYQLLIDFNFHTMNYTAQQLGEHFSWDAEIYADHVPLDVLVSEYVLGGIGWVAIGLILLIDLILIIILIFQFQKIFETSKILSYVIGK
ncbi:hypothetical protein M0812_25349 [Anaeramoeba flamelloides]|uniref:Uncharacterized protein n=1 Tax=Anaeramoeba flamelloides TaxID=1746091 RepID=A0AAV7YGI4_9EUKA|nr:hypothetical protein M0812_25349 [Anaeramoeba flamelloides]